MDVSTSTEKNKQTLSPIARKAREYEALGWKLVPIPPREKAPSTRGWNRPENLKPIPAAWNGNIGLCHGESGTCSIDIDNLRATRIWLFLEYGVDIDKYLEADDAVVIISEQENRAKLIYRLDEPMLKVFHAEDGQQIIDFRCITRKGTSVQDVLPPSIHPSGKAYRWGGKGDWRNPPMLPEELLNVWGSLIDRHKDRRSHDHVEHEAPSAPASNTWDRVEALSYCDPDCDHDTWIHLGMSLKAAGGTFEEYDEWSSKGIKYPGSEAVRTRWDSFEAEGAITPGTLYHNAVESGWEPPRPIPMTAEEMFPAELLGDTVQGESSVPTLDGVAAEIAALSPGDDVNPILAKLVLIDKVRKSDTVARKHCSDIAKAIGSAQAPVWSDYKSALKRYQRIAAEHRAKTAATKRNRYLETAMSKLEAGVSNLPVTEEEIIARYIFVSAGVFEGRFFDRATKSFITPQSFNLLFSSMKSLISNEDEGVTSPSAYFVPRMIQAGYIQYLPGTYAPLASGKDGVLVLNTWEDTGLDPVPGDATPWLTHLAWLIPDKRERRHLLQWLAFLIRHQDRKINHQVMLGGIPRIGKDTLLVPIIAALGENNVNAVRPEQLGEPYYDWALNKKLAIFNELMGSGMGHQRLENTLKPFAAAPPHDLNLRLFGKSASHIQRNLIQIIATTNHRDAFNFSDSKERWFALWCAPTEQLSPEYYIEIHRWMEAGGSANVIHYLHTVPLDDFKPEGNAPETVWQGQLVQQGLAGDVVYTMVRDMLDEGKPPCDNATFKLEDLIHQLRMNLYNDKAAQKQVTRPKVIATLHGLRCGYSGDLQIKDRGVAVRLSLWCRPEALQSLPKHAKAHDWLRLSNPTMH